MSTSNIKTIAHSILALLTSIFGLQKKFNKTPDDYWVAKEEEHRMRHCPKTPDDLADLYAILYKTFKEIEHTELFRTLLNEMQYAKLPLCKTWDDQYALPPIPTVLDAPFETTIVTGADRLSYTVWVLWFEDRFEIVKPYPNRGIYRSNCEEYESHETADTMPDGVIKAAKITIGVVESDNLLKGYQWLLYQVASEA